MLSEDNSTTFRHYQDIADDMRAKITSGEWEPNTMVPSRRALSVEYQVAITTIERAIAMLFAEGRLHADGRRGTYVTSTGDSTQDSNPLYTNSTTLSSVKRHIERATVGIVASIFQYPEITKYEDQWPIHILRDCESMLSSETEITHRFFNCANYESLLENSINLELIEFLKDETQDGLIIIYQDHRLESILAHVDIERIPTIFVTSSQIPYSICQVYYDSASAGYLAAKHLLQRGYRNITYFAPFAYNWVTERQNGVQEAINRTKIPNVSLNVFPVEPVQGEGIKDKDPVTIEQALLLMSSPPDNSWGIVAANDSIAYEVMRASKELGLVAGRDFGLIGFDDFTQSRENGITSLRPPLSAMGQSVAQLMINALRNEIVSERICLSSRLIPRASTMGNNIS